MYIYVRRISNNGINILMHAKRGVRGLIFGLWPFMSIALHIHNSINQ